MNLIDLLYKIGPNVTVHIRHKYRVEMRDITFVTGPKRTTAQCDALRNAGMSNDTVLMITPLYRAQELYIEII